MTEERRGNYVSKLSYLVILCLSYIYNDILYHHMSIKEIILSSYFRDFQTAASMSRITFFGQSLFLYLLILQCTTTSAHLACPCFERTARGIGA